MGEVARLLGVSPRRVEAWVERGWLDVDGVGRGPGRYRSIPYAEVEVARMVVGIMRRLGVKATDELWRYARGRKAAA